ncbi:MAG: hypothetical protein JWQ25_2674 [Daejeonella sp.]|nr:hypothetical protein [Daejeonella sp.]
MRQEHSLRDSLDYFFNEQAFQLECYVRNLYGLNKAIALIKSQVGNLAEFCVRD